MAIEVKVPVLPESVSDATIATWNKKAGDAVSRDENLVDLETDKVVLEVPSPVDGVLKEIKFETGATVTSQQVLAIIEEGAAAAPSKTEVKQEATTAAKTAADSGAAPVVPKSRRGKASIGRRGTAAGRALHREQGRRRCLAGRRHRPQGRGDEGRHRQLRA